MNQRPLEITSLSHRPDDMNNYKVIYQLYQQLDIGILSGDCRVNLNIRFGTRQLGVNGEKLLTRVLWPGAASKVMNDMFVLNDAIKHQLTSYSNSVITTLLILIDENQTLGV